LRRVDLRRGLGCVRFQLTDIGISLYTSPVW